MQLHTLKPAKGSTKKAKRIGRGLGSGHGAYSTRGVKGQRARSGGSSGLKIKGMKQMLLRIPKVRGFKSLVKPAYVLNVSLLNEEFSSGDTITPAVLTQKKLIKPKKGESFRIKILGDGNLTKSFTIKGCIVSKTAGEKIQKAGGTIA